MQYVNDATRHREVKGNMDRPDGATMVGVHSSGVPIYEETVPKYKTRPLKDALGKPVYLMRGGQAVQQRFEQVEDGTVTRKFILNDLGNGVVQKNYDFEASEDEVARIEAAAQATPDAVLARLEKIERGLALSGLALDDLEALAERDAASRRQPPPAK